ncbi:hypothetical protein DFH08DRAFT_711909 [Mycena albidolilacea]|uniref:TNT domain-containing protein n=1 Tax=Mycena albidolilacea TaxID=1033008 RepID=A0AAD6ZHI5_9AGAR|nr:hypothetical protein DFH08DRAFT_711909 [Mycena albidolilacea]
MYISSTLLSSRLITLQTGCKCPTARPNGTEYLCQDERLGPAILPGTPGLAPLLTHYDQLGGLCPDKWLENNTYTPGNGTYRYPLYDGFQRSTANMSIEGEELLLVGTRLDRFGDAGGKYLSPAYTPVEQRSLPPKRLNPTGFPATVEYHVYEVIVPILVRAGTIAAAFGQPGQGTQYELINATVAAWLNSTPPRLKEI